MVTGLSRIEPQTSAAYWKAMRRCWPTVVPGLPPTGAAGVGSLKPSLAPSTLTMVMVAAPKAGAWTISRPARAKRERSRAVVFMAYFSSNAGAAAGMALAALAASTQICEREPSALTWTIQTFKSSGGITADIVPSG